MRLLAAVLCATTLSAAEGFVPLVRGNSLDGWVVDTPGVWSARDGVITGRSEKGLPHNDFLRTAKHYRNFVLRLEFRLAGGSGNSGVQFRSQPVANSHEVSGYQADIGEEYWGCLYDESRRNRVLARPLPGSLEGLDKAGWNRMEISANDNHIVLTLNGRRTVDYTEADPGMDTPGFIALQVHSGGPIQVEFRNIEIQSRD